MAATTQTILVHPGFTYEQMRRAGQSCYKKNGLYYPDGTIPASIEPETDHDEATAPATDGHPISENTEHTEPVYPFYEHPLED